MEVIEALNRAQKLFGEKQYAQAFEIVESAIRGYPNWHYPHTLKGVMLRSQGNLQAAYEAFVAARMINPQDRDAKRHLISLLNYFIPQSAQDPYAMASTELANLDSGLLSEQLATFDSSADAIRDYLAAAEAIVDKYLGEFWILGTQLHRGAPLDLNCDRHHRVFNTTKAIPRFCFDCYKVNVVPKNVVDLFRMHFIFNRTDLPFTFGRKSIVEIRQGVGGWYKGFIYVYGEDDAPTALSNVTDTFKAHKAETWGISLKRGCSEFEQAYPGFSTITTDFTPLVRYEDAWAQHEKNIDEQMNIPWPDHQGASRHHPGLTLLDVFVMKAWLSYAATIGDASFRLLTQREVPVIDGLNRPSFK